MARRSTDGSESRFAAYVPELVSVIGHADRAGPRRDYWLGLIMPGERRSVGPMAAVTAPERTAAQGIVTALRACGVIGGRVAPRG